MAYERPDKPVNQRLQDALHQFAACPGWRAFLHDQDCTDPDNEGQHPDDSLCKCDGPHRVAMVEDALSTEFSPEFDDFDYEPILTWANARVVKNELPPTIKSDSKLAYLANCYSMLWKHGVIGFDIEDEEKSRKAAALFIYLWTRGICANFAERCATAYVVNYTVRRI